MCDEPAVNSEVTTVAKLALESEGAYTTRQDSD